MTKRAINSLYRIFPPITNLSCKLNCDEEGLWSITHPDEATTISINIKKLLPNKNINILDMTAGCGGNTISFCEYFTKVVSIEFDPKRFEILKNNMKCYNYKNYEIYCGDSINYIDNNYDVYFIDPPWGGPEYKKCQNLELYLSNINILDVIKMIPLNKLIVLKLPFNYNINSIMSSYTILLKLEIKNIIILYLLN